MTIDKWAKAERHVPGKPSNIKRKPVLPNNGIDFRAEEPIELLHELLDMLLAPIGPGEEKTTTGYIDVVSGYNMTSGTRLNLTLSSQKLTKEELDAFKRNKGDN